jgi:hypothetical protein
MTNLVEIWQILRTELWTHIIYHLWNFYARCLQNATTKHIEQKNVPVNRKKDIFLFVLLKCFDIQERWTIRRNNKEFPSFERDSIQIRP